MNRDAMTQQIKEQLSYRARMAGFIPDQVFHIDHDGETYIICNPVVGRERESIPDIYGNPTDQVIERRNVEAWVGPLTSERQGDKLVITQPCGLRPILAPWLIAKITADDQIIMAEVDSKPPT
jgi:hypothetical protein